MNPASDLCSFPSSDYLAMKDAAFLYGLGLVYFNFNALTWYVDIVGFCASFLPSPLSFFLTCTNWGWDGGGVGLFP